MGYFNHIIADSRVAAPVMAVMPAVGIANVPGLQTDPSSEGDRQRTTSMDEPRIRQATNAETPARPLPDTMTPAPFSTITSDAQASPARVSSAAPDGKEQVTTTTSLSPTAPQTNSDMVADEASPHWVADMATHQSQTPAVEPQVNPSRPAHQELLASPSSVPMVQRQMHMPGAAEATPLMRPISSPPGHQATVAPASDIQPSPQSVANTTANTAPPEQGVQVAASQAAAVPELTDSSGVTREAAQNRQKVLVDAVPVMAPSVHPTNPRAPQPGLSPQSAAHHTPQVRIGQVNVIVEAPVVPRPPSQVTQTDNLSSRLFLRGL